MVRINRLDFSEKINLGVTLFLILTIIAAIIFSSINQDWFTVFISSLALLLMFLPTLFEKTTKIDLPVEFEIIIVLFIYSSMILGEVLEFYRLIYIWDIILHAISAIGLGFIGFLILFVLYRTDKLKAHPFTIAVFTFAFSLCIGALWEIFEFAMDVNFGLNMQKSGLVDTMWDLITNAAGAFIAAFIGFLYLRRKEKWGIFENLVKRFEKHNPHLFRS